MQTHIQTYIVNVHLYMVASMRYKITKSVKRSPAAPLWHCCRYIVVVCVQIYFVVVFSILRSYKKIYACSCGDCVRQRLRVVIKAAGVCGVRVSKGSMDISDFIKFQFNIRGKIKKFFFVYIIILLFSHCYIFIKKKKTIMFLNRFSYKYF